MAGKNINYTVVERTSPISKKHYVMSQVIPTGSLSSEQLCEDINEDNKKGDPTPGGGGGTEGGTPVPGNTIEG